MGAGFAGIIAGLELEKTMRANFVIVDQQQEVGGTWYANQYPGAEVDVPSLCYLPLDRAKKFFPTRQYSSSREIQQFIKILVEENNLEKKLILNCKVKSCSWDAEKCVWKTICSRKTIDGNQCIKIQSKFLLLGVGPLAIPKFPENKVFEGVRLHSAQWNNSLEIMPDFTDKRVAIIGTGASAAQIIPEIAKSCSRLTVFQRTPAYCERKLNEEYSEPSTFVSEKARKEFAIRKKREFVHHSDEVFLRVFNSKKG